MFDWQKLLISWHEKGKTGLSIPYLLAAPRVLDEDYIPTVEDATQLLNKIFDTGIEGRKLLIRDCPEMQAHVIGIAKDNVYYDVAAIDDTQGIIAEGEVCGEFGNIREELINRLVEEYKDRIINKEYSV